MKLLYKLPTPTAKKTTYRDTQKNKKINKILMEHVWLLGKRWGHLSSTGRVPS
jgi:hypothetical protein